MKIRFAPPHLEHANGVPAVRRAVAQLSTESTEAELRIFQLLSDHELKMSLHVPDGAEVSVMVPKDWLYFPYGEERIQRCLAEIFKSVRGLGNASAA